MNEGLSINHSLHQSLIACLLPTAFCLLYFPSCALLYIFGSVFRQEAFQVGRVACCAMNLSLEGLRNIPSTKLIRATPAMTLKNARRSSPSFHVCERMKYEAMSGASAGKPVRR